MKIIFFGTGKFALATLKKLFEARHEIAAVVTQPDRKKGRGWNVYPTAVKALAEKIMPGINIFQPDKALDNEFIEILKKQQADVFVVIDYGRILPSEVLTAARKYCINLHPSLLPKYRGPAPINRAILNGEKETGLTVMKINERMDAGDILTQERVPIKETDNALSLSEKLSAQGANLILKVLDAIEQGKETFVKQDESKATYAAKLEKKEAEIDWNEPAEKIVRKIKGLQPWPGAYTYLDARLLKIFDAKTIISASSLKNKDFGAICDEEKFIVSTGKGSIQITRLQIEGKKPMTTEEFLKGRRLNKGTTLGNK
ncbi:MAG: methionyl-tRNA formyltransferase [Candidatus Omnitrophota bacterium]